MKKILFSLIFAALNVRANTGHDQGGGGDLCEDRIKLIRDDIKTWVEDGGPKSLTLPQGISVDGYSRQMLAQIAITKIKCVSDGDAGFPVTVLGTAKTCRFDKTEQNSSITCDFHKFQAASESDQYVLIMHELGGLAEVEIPNGDDSNYFISNQVTDYLVDQFVKKLAVKKNTTGESLEELFNDKQKEAQAQYKKSILRIRGCNTDNFDVCSKILMGLPLPDIQAIEIKSNTEAYVEDIQGNVSHLDITKCNNLNLSSQISGYSVGNCPAGYPF